MPPNAEPGSRPASASEERAQEEEVHRATIRSPTASNAEGAASTGTSAAVADGAGEDDERRGAEEPGGVPRDDDLLAEELPQLEVGLPDGRARAGSASRAFIQRISPTSPGAEQQRQRRSGRAASP